MAEGHDKTQATAAVPGGFREVRLPTRDELARLPKDVLRHGNNCSPDVYACEWCGERIVVKDYAPKGRLTRWVMGWPLIAHEGRILQRLQGVRGVPRFRGRPDRFALAMSAMDGVPFHSRLGRKYACDHRNSVSVLAGIVEDMHARGVVHLDLQHKGNILVTPRGQPRLVDFASTLRFAPSSRLGRLLTSCLGCADRLALIKCKRNVAPKTLSPPEAHWLRVWQRTRDVWLPRILMDAFYHTVRRRPRRGRAGALAVPREQLRAGAGPGIEPWDS